MDVSQHQAHSGVKQRKHTATLVRPEEGDSTVQEERRRKHDTVGGGGAHAGYVHFMAGAKEKLQSVQHTYLDEPRLGLA